MKQDRGRSTADARETVPALNPDPTWAHDRPSWADSGLRSPVSPANAPRRPRGQMTVLFAVMAVALFGFMALTIDGGYAFSHRRSMQNAADAASLAGTRVLASYGVGTPITNRDVWQAVVNTAVANSWLTDTGTLQATYIYTNRVSLGSVPDNVLAPPPLASGVYVTATTTYNTFFGGLIGVSSLSSSANAKSIYGFTCTANCLLPITIYTQTFVTGATYDFYGSNAGPGQFGWLNFSGGSSTDLCNDLAVGSCNSGAISQYGWVPGSSGNNWPSCVQDSNRLPAWVGKTAAIAIFGPGPGVSPGGSGCNNSDTLCNTGTCTSACGQGSNFYYHIVGFASFRITAYDGNNKTIQGVYQNTVANAELVPGCAANFGTTAINLIR